MLSSMSVLGNGALKTASYGDSASPHSNFHFAAQVIEGGVMKVYRGVSKVLIAGGVYTGARVQSASVDRIGGTTAGTLNGTTRIAAVAKHRLGPKKSEVLSLMFPRHLFAEVASTPTSAYRKVAPAGIFVLATILIVLGLIIDTELIVNSVPLES